MTAPCCGNGASARAARLAACNGAWLPMTRTSMSPSRMSACKESRRGTPGGQKSSFGSVELKMDPRAGGGIFALKLATGEIVWRTPHPGCNDRPGCSPAQSAAVTAIPGIVFSGGLDGHLRAYAAKTGEIIWDVDTMQEYQTVTGAPAHGGSLRGPGAVVAGGMLYVNSGYANYGTAPGNVMVAFSVEGE